MNRQLQTSAARQLLIATLTVAFASFCIILGGRTPDAFSSAAASSPTAPLATSRVVEAYGQLPLSFEANRGQADQAVNFVARGAGYTLSLSPTAAVFDLARQPDKQTPAQQKMLRMSLVGSNEGAPVAGLNELEGKVNYFIGNDPAQWRTNIPTFARVRYNEVYPGIDVVYYGNQKRLEYDFVVAPGRDPGAVRLHFEGADKVEVDAAGDLLLNVGESVIRQPKPVVYQEVDGERLAVAGAYTVARDAQVGFAVGGYDAQRPLIIDPVLVYSTYLGGSGDDSVRDIALDSSGNAYVCGETTSTNFPTANAFDATFNTGNTASDRDTFVTKLNAAGTALVYSTYLGGTGNTINLSGDDTCTGIAIDSAGNAYLAGETRSTDFPTANALQGTFGGGLFEGFLTKLNAAGSALVYSTYIGGNTFDSAASVAVDSSGNAYVAGRTTSTNFATVNPIQSTFAGGGSDAFIMKLNAAGSALIYSTYLGGGGGNGFDAAFSIAIDAAGNAYITGPTLSTDFPTANAIQATYGGGTDGDAYVAKLNAAGSALVYSTYLGGSDSDTSQDITVDSSGNAHVTGSTSSTNFPTANAFDSTLSGTSDAFVTKLNAAGSAFVYSTYLGGAGFEAGNDIVVDSTGNAHVAGTTDSTDFPTVNPTQGTYGGGLADALVTKFNAAGSALLFSTYLGGSASDRGNAIAVDSAGSIYVAGATASTNFPTLNPVQATNGGADDAFVTKISDSPGPTSAVQFSSALHTAQEDCTSIVITVSRSGSLAGTTTVDYMTSDVTASQRMDYGIALGRLTFAPNETTKVIPVLINEDSYVEGLETATISLSNPTGGTLGLLSTATIQIIDDATEPSTNVIDDPGVFVCQQYHDFLNRDPDPAGFAGWVNVLNTCPPGSTACDRIEISASFFRSEEFQARGFFVYLFYSTAFGRKPQYLEFMRDLSLTTGFLSDAQLEAGKVAFIDEFMLRPEFTSTYAALTDPAAYVNALEQTAGVTLPNKQQLIDGLTQGSLTRAEVLRAIAGSNEVKIRYFRQAFVVEAYFGYLRREPDALFNTWIQIFDQTNDYRNIINGFLNSSEYRLRFAP